MQQPIPCNLFVLHDHFQHVYAHQRLASESIVACEYWWKKQTTWKIHMCTGIGHTRNWRGEKTNSRASISHTQKTSPSTYNIQNADIDCADTCEWICIRYVPKLHGSFSGFIDLFTRTLVVVIIFYIVCGRKTFEMHRVCADGRLKWLPFVLFCITVKFYVLASFFVLCVCEPAYDVCVSESALFLNCLWFETSNGQ